MTPKNCQGGFLHPFGRIAQAEADLTSMSSSCLHWGYVLPCSSSCFQYLFVGNMFFLVVFLSCSFPTIPCFMCFFQASFSSAAPSSMRSSVVSKESPGSPEQPKPKPRVTSAETERGNKPSGLGGTGGELLRVPGVEDLNIGREQHLGDAFGQSLSKPGGKNCLPSKPLQKQSIWIHTEYCYLC